MTTLREVRLRCPICDKNFKSQEVVATNAFGGKRTDFHVRAIGVQPTPHLVHICPQCGYAGKDDRFAEDAVPTSDVAEHVWSELAPRLTGAPLSGSERYEFAATIALWSGGPSVELGDLYLRAAWCCVEEGDVEAERYFRRHAAWSFERALAEWEGVEREARALLTYLVGELWRRIGDDARAHEWFDRVPDEITDPATQQWLVDIARRQKDDPREWFAGEASGVVAL